MRRGDGGEAHGAAIAKRGITEALKQDDPVHWVQEMNSVKAAVREIVCAEIIDVG